MERPLSELLQGLDGHPFGAWDGATASGLEIDSRRVAAGALFVALPGSRTDGADHVADALRRGARGLVLPLAREPPAGVPGTRVADPRRALSVLADRFYGHPSGRLPVVGVTGSNGKTTVTYMAAQALAAAGLRPAYWSTNEVHSGVRRFRPALTTAEAHDLHRFLSEALDSGMSHACIEVSSHAVVQKRVADVRFAAGVVTGVTPDHLDFHGSFEAYLAAKAEFLHALRPPAPCIYNADDAGARLAVRGVGTTAISYGFGAEADLRGLEPRLGRHSSHCVVRLSPRAAGVLPGSAGGADERFPLSVPVPGHHNLHNALAALAAALAMGVPVDAARAALAEFAAPPRRLRVRRVGECTVIDDVAMNEASFDAVFGTVAELCYPRLVVVVALRGNRGTEVNGGIGRTLGRWNRRLAFAPVIASLSRTALARYTLDHHVRPEELRAFEEGGRLEGLSWEVHDELGSAIRRGVERLGGQGALLLLGTFGMDEGAALAIRLMGGEGAEEHPLPTWG